MEFLTSGIRRTAGARARLPFVLSSLSGVRLNSAEVGRLLGISHPTAFAYLRHLEEVGLVTRVPHYGGGKRPLLIAWEDPSPRASLLRTLQDLRPDCRLHWWECTRARVVSLLADLGNGRVGFCFSSAQRPGRRDWLPLALAINRGVIDRGFLLHAGDRAFKPHGLPVFCLPLHLFTEQLGEWMFAWRAPTESWQAMVRINKASRPRPGFP